MSLFNVFSGQGNLYAAARNPTTGLPGPLLDLGEIDDFKISGSQDSFNIQTNRLRGNRAIINRIDRAAEFTGSFNLKSFSPKNVAYGLFSQVVDVTSGTATNEAFPSGLIVGDEVILARRGKTSALTLVDSTATPVTLVEGTHYAHSGYGRITILSVTGITQPIKASTYTVEAVKEVPILTGKAGLVWLHFDGENTGEVADNGFAKRFSLDLRRVQFSLAGDMSFINPSDYGSVPMNFTILPDPKVIATDTVSAYGKMTYLDIA